MRYFNEDDPIYHYPADCINVEDKVVLDLGCGNIGQLSTLTFQSTPEYFLSHGAKKVIGVELDLDDIAYLRGKVPEQQGFFLDSMLLVDDIAKLITDHNVQVIKCDNEGGEGELFVLDNSTFKCRIFGRIVNVQYVVLLIGLIQYTSYIVFSPSFIIVRWYNYFKLIKFHN